jgi:hypothetical protein
MRARTAALGAAALGCTCGTLVLLASQGRHSGRTALEVVRFTRLGLGAPRSAAMLATRQDEEEVGALNSWGSKGTMYIKTPGMFAAGEMGMDVGGAALMVSCGENARHIPTEACVADPLFLSK